MFAPEITSQPVRYGTVAGVLGGMSGLPKSVSPESGVLEFEDPESEDLSVEAERDTERKVRGPRVPTTDLRVKDTHRLIASRYSESGTVLSRLTADAGSVAHLLELDDATNDRFLGEEGLLPGIGIHELVYGIRYAHIVNAAFTHASPGGGRFNSATRGAWYASLDRSTSIAEVAFHKLRQLDEIDWQNEEISTSDDYLADITSPFHDLRAGLQTGLGMRSGGRGTGGEDAGRSGGAAPLEAALPGGPGAGTSMTPAVRIGAAAADQNENAFARYLRPEPIPRCYLGPQHLAERLLTRRSNGIIYPSVRRPGGTCVVVFRPALVYNVRRGARLEFRLRSKRPFRPSHAREVPIPKG